MTSRGTLTEFEDHLRGDHASERTVTAYRRDVVGFLDYVAQEWDGEISGKALEAWFDQLAAQGDAASTLARRLTSVRRFCRWLVERGELDSDPTADIRVPGPNPDEAQRPAELDVEAMEQVLAAPYPYTPLGVRDRAMLLLLADTGMELGELCRLDFGDVDFVQRGITVGRGRRRRTVRTYRSWGSLLRHLRAMRAGSEDEALFLSKRGERISERAVQHRVAHYARQEGVQVSVQDIIDLGRIRRASAPPKWAARELGYARPDVVARRYGTVDEAPEMAEEEVDLSDAAVVPIDGMPAGSAPMPSGSGRRPVTKADVWARLEHEARQDAKLPPLMGGVWEELKLGGWLEPAEWLKRYAQPVTRGWKRLEEEINRDGSSEGRRRRVETAGGLRGISSMEDLPQEAESDDGLLKLRAVLLASHSGLEMSSRLVRASSETDPAFTRWFAEEVAEDDGLRETLVRCAEAAEHEDYVNPFEELTAYHLLGDTMQAVSWMAEVLGTVVGQALLWALVDAYWEELQWAKACAVEYYEIEDEPAVDGEVNVALIAALVVALVVCDPDAVRRAQVSPVVERPALMYLLDTLHTQFYLLLRMLGHAPDALALKEIESDKEFVRRFEAEWDRLLPYSNGFFGFAVVPRLSYEAMAYYHRLKYRPRGKLESIPYELGDYLVHQAKGSMHFLRPFLPTRVQDAFFDCIKPLFGRLLWTVASKLAEVMAADFDGLEEALEKAEARVGKSLRQAFDRYDFYQHPPGRPATRMSGGVLGVRRRPDLRQLAQTMGLPVKRARTPFAAYAQGRLMRMLLRDRRALRAGGVGLTLPAPRTGDWYCTISRMAARCGCSSHALRRLDWVLKPARVSDVFPRGKVPGHPLLPASTRLYRADAESVERVKAQLQRRSRAGKARSADAT